MKRLALLLVLAASGCTFDLQVGELPNAITDSGAVDAGAIDAGPALDAGVDAGPSMDAGETNDAGPDAGTIDGGVLPVSVGRLAVGKNHTCGLNDVGAVFCWGLNDKGQLGNGTRVSTGVPTPVTGLSSGVVAVGAGVSHSCAITAAGAVLCWGENSEQQLGDGSGLSRPVPGPTWISQGAVALALGTGHTCVLLRAGTVSCWSENFRRQLDVQPTSTGTLTPIPAAGSQVTEIAAAVDRTCALSGGRVYCWGDDTLGAVVPGIVDAQRLAVGELHACAVVASGVVCWGNNYSAQLGVGPAWSATPISSLPTSAAVPGLAVGRIHSCAVVDGRVKCWGSSTSGQLGLGATRSSGKPTDVALPAAAVEVSAGFERTCARLVDGSWWCWGDGAMGGVGNGFANLVPTAVPGVTAARLVAGEAHQCALSVDGGLDCWGSNQFGQLSGAADGGAEPVRVAGVVAPVGLGASTFSSCAVDSSGQLRCWGEAPFSGTNRSSVPAQVLGIGAAGVSDVWSGDMRTCALQANGTLACWRGGSGGTVATVDVGFAPKKVVLGPRHACALGPIGQVACWGDNSIGQLGQNTKTPISGVVMPMFLDAGVRDLAAGQDFTCAQPASGPPRCWGIGNSGQLGFGTVGEIYAPAKVKGLDAGATALFAGRSTVCALDTTGRLLCWGSNENCLLGTGDARDWAWEPKPTTVVGEDVRQLAFGLGSACALKGDGGVSCWGGNGVGQLGHPNWWGLPQPVLPPN